ncbi:MAG TPA: BTAD domain-containing putative transcriptional regulator [Acetobacteraceae bacterium]|nr:BTAD domain-containing putative transcriptional regulator [Acetobacteraceae bacterium]
MPDSSLSVATVAAGQVRLQAALLGPARFAVAGLPVHGLGRKARAVLAYLLLSGGLQETRERLVGLLWSESDEERARASLRQTLREIRTAFAAAGYEGFRTDKLAVSLDAASVELDVAHVTAEAEALRAHPLLLDQPRAADLLLQDLDDVDPEFRGWLLAKRHSLQERLMRALEAGIGREDLGREARMRLAEAAINLDPTHEEACRALMQARAEAGDIAGALKAYKQLWDLLDDEYGMEPSAATQRLVADIKSGVFDHAPEPPPPRQAPSAPRAGGSKPLLSVGPVDIRGLAADKPHLIEGFRQNLIASLVRFREWYVTDQPIEGAGPSGLADLGARYEVSIIAGDGDNAVGLVLILKEIDANVFVWSEGFELKPEQWFHVQRQIVARIASVLQVHLSAERIMRLAGEPDISLSLYDRWLRCRRQIRSFGHEEWEHAAREFERIIAEAPHFTAAHCSLAEMSNSAHIVHPGVMRTQEAARRSLELARRAVQLDPIDTRAQLCLGWAHAMIGQFDSADLHMDLACELNPQDSWTQIAVALFKAFRGRPDEARTLARPALDPALRPSRTHWAYEVSIAYLAGDYEGTLRATDLAMDTIKTLPAWRAAALFRLGRTAEARADAARFIVLARGAWCSAETPTDEAITRWLLHLYPISNRADWEHLREGLSGAGLPAGGARYEAWWNGATGSY